MNPHGNPTHGGRRSITYERWQSMMARCHNPNASNYRYYGAKGITVCPDWHDFAHFRDDMGECPSRRMTLDRIENSKGYMPGNCRWATKSEQNRNRSHCIELTQNGVTKILAGWAADIGLTPNALSMRLRLGWSVERALTTPKKTKTYRKST